VKRIKYLITLALVFSSITALFTINASAYLDPSAMTYIIQAVAGVVIAGGAAFVIYWKKIKLFFKKRKK
jgi:high-affinity Fe2+/Pb2+ permease